MNRNCSVASVVPTVSTQAFMSRCNDSAAAAVTVAAADLSSSDGGLWSTPFVSTNTATGNLTGTDLDPVIFYYEDSRRVASALTAVPAGGASDGGALSGSTVSASSLPVAAVSSVTPVTTATSKFAAIAASGVDLAATIDRTTGGNCKNSGALGDVLGTMVPLNSGNDVINAAASDVGVLPTPVVGTADEANGTSVLSAVSASNQFHYQRHNSLHHDDSLSNNQHHINGQLQQQNQQPLAGQSHQHAYLNQSSQHQEHSVQHNDNHVQQEQQHLHAEGHHSHSLPRLERATQQQHHVIDATVRPTAGISQDSNVDPCSASVSLSRTIDSSVDCTLSSVSILQQPSFEATYIHHQHLQYVSPQQRVEQSQQHHQQQHSHTHHIQQHQQPHEQPLTQLPRTESQLSRNESYAQAYAAVLAARLQQPQFNVADEIGNDPEMPDLPEVLDLHQPSLSSHRGTVPGNTENGDSASLYLMPHCQQDTSLPVLPVLHLDKNTLLEFLQTPQGTGSSSDHHHRASSQRYLDVISTQSPHLTPTTTSGCSSVAGSTSSQQITSHCLESYTNNPLPSVTLTPHSSQCGSSNGSNTGNSGFCSMSSGVSPSMSSSSPHDHHLHPHSHTHYLSSHHMVPPSSHHGNISNHSITDNNPQGGNTVGLTSLGGCTSLISSLASSTSNDQLSSLAEESQLTSGLTNNIVSSDEHHHSHSHEHDHINLCNGISLSLASANSADSGSLHNVQTHHCASVGSTSSQQITGCSSVSVSNTCNSVGDDDASDNNSSGRVGRNCRRNGVNSTRTQHDVHCSNGGADDSRSVNGHFQAGSEGPSDIPVGNSGLANISGQVITSSGQNQSHPINHKQMLAQKYAAEELQNNSAQCSLLQQQQQQQSTMASQNVASLRTPANSVSMTGTSHQHLDNHSTIPAMAVAAAAVAAVTVGATNGNLGAQSTASQTINMLTDVTSVPNNGLSLQSSSMVNGTERVVPELETCVSSNLPDVSSIQQPICVGGSLAGSGQSGASKQDLPLSSNNFIQDTIMGVDLSLAKSQDNSSFLSPNHASSQGSNRSIDDLATMPRHPKKDRYPSASIRRSPQVSPSCSKPKPVDEYCGSFCEDCGLIYERECSLHKPCLIQDQWVVSRAFASLPSNHLVIQDLSPVSADLGCQSSASQLSVLSVFTKKPIPRKTMFGPMIGVLFRTSQKPSSAFPIFISEDSNGCCEILDTQDEERSNWMRFVRPATSPADQNLSVVQKGQQIFFEAIDYIPPHAELRVWYSESYAQRYRMLRLLREEYECFDCGRNFFSTDILLQHIMSEHHDAQHNVCPSSFNVTGNSSGSSNSPISISHSNSINQAPCQSRKSKLTRYSGCGQYPEVASGSNRALHNSATHIPESPVLTSLHEGTNLGLCCSDSFTDNIARKCKRGLPMNGPSLYSQEFMPCSSYSEKMLDPVEIIEHITQAMSDCGGNESGSSAGANGGDSSQTSYTCAENGCSSSTQQELLSLQHHRHASQDLNAHASLDTSKTDEHFHEARTRSSETGFAQAVEILTETPNNVSEVLLVSQKDSSASSLHGIIDSNCNSVGQTLDVSKQPLNVSATAQPCCIESSNLEHSPSDQQNLNSVIDRVGLTHAGHCYTDNKKRKIEYCFSVLRENEKSGIFGSISGCSMLPSTTLATTSSRSDSTQPEVSDALQTSLDDQTSDFGSLQVPSKISKFLQKRNQRPAVGSDCVRSAVEDDCLRPIEDAEESSVNGNKTIPSSTDSSALSALCEESPSSRKSSSAAKLLEYSTTDEVNVSAVRTECLQNAHSTEATSMNREQRSENVDHQRSKPLLHQRRFIKNIKNKHYVRADSLAGCMNNANSPLPACEDSVLSCSGSSSIMQTLSSVNNTITPNVAYNQESTDDSSFRQKCLTVPISKLSKDAPVNLLESGSTTDALPSSASFTPSQSPKPSPCDAAISSATTLSQKRVVASSESCAVFEKPKSPFAGIITPLKKKLPKSLLAAENIALMRSTSSTNCSALSFSDKGHDEVQSAEVTSAVVELAKHETSATATVTMQKSKKPAEIPCLLCDDTFVSASLLKQHSTRHRTPAGFKCPRCPRLTQDFYLMRRHIKLYHIYPKYKSFSCKVCGKTFWHTDKYQRHMKVHESSDKKFKCGTCGKILSRKDKLSEHMLKMHMKDSGKAGTSQEHLVSHSKEDADSTEHVGNILRQSPETTGDVTASERISRLKKDGAGISTRTFNCSNCGRGFRKRGMLAKHYVKLHPEVPIDQTLMEGQFVKVISEFPCPYCEKCYKSSSKRKQHIEQKHPSLAVPQSYKTMAASVNATYVRCPWCPAQYTVRCKLYAHQRSKHGPLLAILKVTGMTEESWSKTEQSMVAACLKAQETLEQEQQGKNKFKKNLPRTCGELVQGDRNSSVNPQRFAAAFSTSGTGLASSVTPITVESVAVEEKARGSLQITYNKFNKLKAPTCR